MHLGFVILFLPYIRAIIKKPGTVNRARKQINKRISPIVDMLIDRRTRDIKNTIINQWYFCILDSPTLLEFS